VVRYQDRTVHWPMAIFEFTNFCFVFKLAYDFGVCTSSPDIASSRTQNHPCISRLNTCDWGNSGVGTVCIVLGL
jgi:hypothetical protein